MIIKYTPCVAIQQTCVGAHTNYGRFITDVANKVKDDNRKVWGIYNK